MRLPRGSVPVARGLYFPSMPQPPVEAPSAPASRQGGPSMLDLVRLSRDAVFPPGGEDLYRTIARLTEMRGGCEVLVAASGRGMSTLFLARSTGCEAVGVETDGRLADEAEQRAREAGLEGVTFQAAAPDDLPYRDGIFDVALGEIGLAAAADPAAAVRELARVTRPMGCVVLVQLIWTGNVDAERREVLVPHLGARPLFLVEWKQLLRDAGVVDLRVEDWSHAPSPFRPQNGGAPFPDMAVFPLRERLAILRRALGRWGWRGVRGAVLREREVHRLLTRERVLGLSLIVGTKWPAPLPEPAAKPAP
ncbi:MAG: Methyltransferase protein [Gemmatimonadetes bacterium]|nr:Methyltransferase protein [Gemmatimonadota bacterium]